MIRTITLGEHVFVQGLYVGRLPDGRISVRDGDRVFSGVAVPVLSRATPPPPAPPPAPTHA